MYLSDRHSVDAALRVGDYRVDVHHVLRRLCWNCQVSGHQVLDVFQGTVAVVDVRVVMTVSVMFVVMIVMMPRAFLSAVDKDLQTGPGYAAFDSGLFNESNARYPGRIKLFDEGVWFRKKFEKCGREHVARCTHAAVQIEYLHLLLASM